MKKIVPFLTCIMMMVMVGCTTTHPTTKTHTITYYVDGEVIELEPNIYEEGEEMVLPTPLIAPGSQQSFDGWYLNKNYIGEKIKAIDKSMTKDIVVYGKLVEQKDTYTITYRNGGAFLDLTPNTYQRGDTFALPKLTIDDGDFLGWYTTADFTGEQVTSITSDMIGDIVLYAKTETFTPDLADALNKDNYTYVVRMIGDGQTVDYTYLFHQGDVYYKDSDDASYDQYLVTINGEKRYIYNDNGVWYYIPESDVYFMYYEMMFQVVNLKELSTNDFTYDPIHHCFQADDNKLQTVSQLLLGYYDQEVFDSFCIYVENNQVSKMTFSSLYNYDGDIITYEYIVTFSDYDKTMIDIPDATLYDGAESTISSVYHLENGTTGVTVTGVITGVYGNNFYIADEEKGILIYCGSTSDYVNRFSLGDVVTVTGDVQIYKGVHQLTNISNVASSNKEITPFSITLKNLEQTTLEQYANDAVHVENAVIQTLPSSYPLTGSDVSFTIELSGNCVTVFMSKHLDTASKTIIFDYLQQKNIGDLIDLYDVHVSHYNAYQLTLTNAATIEDGYKDGDPIAITRIETSPDQLLIGQGATLDEIVSQISVYAVYNDKTKVLLNSGEYVLEHRFVANTVGEFTFNYTYEGFKAVCLVCVAKVTDSFYPELNTQPLYEVLSQMGYDVETGQTYGINKGLPSIGTPEVLIIPIAFSDCPAPSDMVSNLQKVFFGTSEETGWESLNSYYKKSSYGKLDIQGKVLEPFNTGKTVAYYDKLQNEYNKALDAYYNYETDVYPDNVEFSMIQAALKYYDSIIDYSKYDSDHDGYIDSIYFVYTTDYNSTDDSSLWWAFTTEYFTEDYEYYDNVEVDFYTFFSYQFIFDELQGKKVQYNAETIIHETGHLLGLTDYYDYDNTVGPSGGIGGGDMMDYNVGDHNAYSKLLLGWVTPLVVSGQTTTVELESFAESGDCVFIFNEWNGTFFDEYYVIDFYTPTGLNEFCKGSSGLFSTSGIRIYHVDATLNNPEDCYSIFDVTKCNNTDSSHRLISLVEADGRGNIDNNGYSENSDLFQVNDKLANVKWYTGEKAKFTVTVTSITSTKATITITY